MKVKELIKILSIFSEQEQEKEILINSYGNPIHISAIDYDGENYIIMFEKCET